MHSSETPGSDHYSLARARHYHRHHRDRLRTRLTSWREQRCLIRALIDAGSPSSLLDLPCGTGRFWRAAAKADVETLIAADGSPGMLEVAAANRVSESIPQRLLETSAFAIDLPDNSVAAVACLRFLHHLSGADDRQTLLRELTRVSRRHIVVSLWVDGNYAGNRRMRKPARAPVAGYGPRICRRRADVEAEFVEAGCRIVKHYDVWPGLSMWRFYLLEHGTD
jgi:SAM-dependent methyltransferase